MELSKRLLAVAGLVTEGASVADVGTDHGYVPVWLKEKKAADKVLALDINKGPLERAECYIMRCGWEGSIETRLSDGLKEVDPGEVDTMIAAGMGGPLIIRILSEGETVVSSLHTLILQPQSEIGKVRRYLNVNGFCITEEDMVLEAGKYYSVMKAVHGERESYEEWEYLYGKRLLEKKHPVLHQYLLREIKLRKNILEQLNVQGETRAALKRRKEIVCEIETIEKALSCYGKASGNALHGAAF